MHAESAATGVLAVRQHLMTTHFLLALEDAYIDGYRATANDLDNNQP